MWSCWSEAAALASWKNRFRDTSVAPRGRFDEDGGTASSRDDGASRELDPGRDRFSAAGGTVSSWGASEPRGTGPDRGAFKPAGGTVISCDPAAGDAGAPGGGLVA